MALNEKNSHRKKYICNRCNYKFRFKDGTRAALRCPNCGRTEISEDKFDINRVIDESGKSMYDF